MKSPGMEVGMYPNIEVEVFVGYRFDVETDGRYRRDNLSNLANRINIRYDFKGSCGWFGP